MRYKITHYCKYAKPSTVDSSHQSFHSVCEEYDVKSADECKTAIHDLLDALDKKMTVADVMHDFDADSTDMTKADAKNICKYYNSRFSISLKLNKLIDEAVGLFNVLVHVKSDWSSFCLPSESKSKLMSSYVKVTAYQEDQEESNED